MFNHHENNSVEMHLSLVEMKGGMVDYYIVATRHIKAGEELLVSYGSKEWFQDRGIEMKNHTIVYDNDRQTEVVDNLDCPLSAVRVEYEDTSSTSSINTARPTLTPRPAPPVPSTTTPDHWMTPRVYATRPIEQGELLEVSRAIIMPAWHAQGTWLEKMGWYRHTSGGVDVGVLVLLGYGALYRPYDTDRPLNEQGTGSDTDREYSDICAERGPNLMYSWAPLGRWSATPNEHIICEEEMFISFVAARDIAEGEELTVPLRIMPDILGKTRRRIQHEHMLPGNCIATMQNSLQHFVLSRGMEQKA